MTGESIAFLSIGAFGTVVAGGISGLAAVLSARVNRSVGSNGGSTVHEQLGRLSGLLEAHINDDGRHWNS